MMSKDSSAIGPTIPSERILSLDVLRGISLFGVLWVNIQLFSMIVISIPNPTAFGDLTGLNYWLAVLRHIFVEQKFMNLFSILFGAGVLLMTRNIESRGSQAAGRHFLRMMWLIVIGLMHAYLLWWGDILVTYGLCGLVVYLFRKMSAKKLLIIGLIAVCIASLILVFMYWSIPDWPKERLEQAVQRWQPGAEIIAKEIDAYQGGWWQQMAHRVPAALGLQTFSFLTLFFWRDTGLMLIGMALFKWGVLTAAVSKKCYRNFLIIGLAAGLPLVSLGWMTNTLHNWDYKFFVTKGFHFNCWGSIFLSLAYIGGIMLICQVKRLAVFTRPFAAVGRMAFTNYLMQTIICTTIFYGHGFGLFGKVDRTGQMILVFLIFGFQLWASSLWLKYFRFGPFEWLWRSLTYRKMPPMRNKQ